MNKAAASAAQNQQCSGKVSAVYAGNVLRIERCEGLRVVPVVKMTSVALQLAKGLKRRFEPVRKLLRTNPAEISCAECGNGIETHVGRGSSMGDPWLGILLKIIRRQKVICLRATKRSKKRQVRRRLHRRPWRRQREGASTSSTGGGTLIQRAIGGRRDPKHNQGKAAPQCVMAKINDGSQR